ncbi:hypothetical protein BCR34DRAFT_560446 [Clohesyomyces aquaticus]|uniref:Uncharacterized protein n=1 Tax=Clohesyomyces aquaticus TaxID=1231657 RepID=A0A1Y1ZW95_9PLEO|nr:hypothetical protein BCR34DRAFT_560446 [Clohesyomyces aquaticus]
MPILQFPLRALSRRTAFSPLRSNPSRSQIPTRLFSQSSRPRGDDTRINDTMNTDSSSKMDDAEHATKKKDRLDVQSANAQAGMDAKGEKSGGNATEEGDGGAMKKAKKEFPEAPDVAIGMQDERGGRGGR